MRLAIIELLDRDGHARLIVPVTAWPVTIGRAIDCDVVLDDAHAAARHATLTGVGASGDAGVTDTGGASGADAALTLTVGETIKARRRSGWTRHRLHAAAHRLADHHGVWSGFWSVGSKLVQHRFDFWSHVRVVLSYSLIMAVVGTALPIAAFITGWPILSRVATISNMALAGALVLAHLVLIMPAYRRGLTVTVAAVFVAGVSLQLVYTYQKQDRLFSQLYVTTLGPPSLRLAPAVETSTFLDEVRALKPVLDEHAKDDDDDSEGYE